MNRLCKLFEQNRARRRKLLSIFITAGYPELDSAPELVRTLEMAGADFVEIGVPFSDPIADGPTIQKASQHALENGMNLKMVLEQIQIIRRQSQIPIILMGYFNPMMNYGLEKMVADAEAVGVDGFIIPDLLPEEFLRCGGVFEGSSLGVNFLVSPNTPLSRIRKIDGLTRDFIYCVSVTGVTGVRQGIRPELFDFLKSVRGQVEHPYLVGFGISKPTDARKIVQYCDGVIIGSAVINRLKRDDSNIERLDAVGKLVRQIKLELREA